MPSPIPKGLKIRLASRRDASTLGNPPGVSLIAQPPANVSSPFRTKERIGRHVDHPVLGRDGSPIRTRSLRQEILCLPHSAPARPASGRGAGVKGRGAGGARLVQAKKTPYSTSKTAHHRLNSGQRRQSNFPANAPVAQLDSASVFGTEGYRFESYRVYFQCHQQTNQGHQGPFFIGFLSFRDG